MNGIQWMLHNEWYILNVTIWMLCLWILHYECYIMNVTLWMALYKCCLMNGTWRKLILKGCVMSYGVRNVIIDMLCYEKLHNEFCIRNVTIEHKTRILELIRTLMLKLPC